MTLLRKRLGLAAIAVLAYGLILVVVWASRPIEDSVPVGIDWSPTVLVPPGPQQPVSQRVVCNTLFAGRPRPDEPLPTLTEQPKDRPELAFQREPCKLPYADARRNFAINVIAVIAALASLGFLARRWRRADDVTAAPTTSAHSTTVG
jgi:hypothetical protein